MKIKNKKPFYFGIILLLVLIYSLTTPQKGFSINPVLFQDFLGYSFVLILSIFLLTYGIFPKSRLGYYGGKIYKMYSNIRRKSKK